MSDISFVERSRRTTKSFDASSSSAASTRARTSRIIAGQEFSIQERSTVIAALLMPVIKSM